MEFVIPDVEPIAGTSGAHAVDLRIDDVGARGAEPATGPYQRLRERFTGKLPWLIGNTSQPWVTGNTGNTGQPRLTGNTGNAGLVSDL